MEISKHVLAEEGKKIAYCTTGAVALPPRFCTNRIEYDMPNLENLSVRGDEKEQNFDMHGNGSNYEPMVPLLLENRREDFDDGIKNGYGISYTESGKIK